MNEDILHKLFDIADQVRSMGQRRPDLIEVIKAARDADVPVSLDTLRAFANRHGDPSDGSVFLCPAIVADFAIEFLRGRAIESIFDPWAGSLLLLPLVDALHPASATGLVPSERQLVATRIVRPQVNVNWMAVYPIGHFPELRETFDVIVSCPPMGMAPETLTINVGDGEITIRDNAEALLILQACMRLKPDGIALIVVPNGFFHSRRANSVYATLPRFGLAVDAAITIPQGTFRPVTSMSATLAVIQHGSSERMFVVRPKSWTGRLIKYDVSKRRIALCVNAVNSAPSSRRASSSRCSVGRSVPPRSVASTN